MVPLSVILIECVTEDASSLVCHPYEPYDGDDENCQSVTPSSAKSIEASCAGWANAPLKANDSAIAPGENVSLGVT